MAFVSTNSSVELEMAIVRFNLMWDYFFIFLYCNITPFQLDALLSMGSCIVYTPNKNGPLVVLSQLWSPGDIVTTLVPW